MAFFLPMKYCCSNKKEIFNSTRVSPGDLALTKVPVCLAGEGNLDEGLPNLVQLP